MMRSVIFFLAVTTCYSWQIPGFDTSVFKLAERTTDTKSYENSKDSEFPWMFRGRAVMRPALVRVDTDKVPSTEGVQVLSLAGWTIGGTVALEYDESPVGPYREYVCLGGLGLSTNKRRVIIGQYGSRLCVSDPRAEELCRQVWDLVAEQETINFDSGERLSMSVDPKVTDLTVGGWNLLREDNTRKGFRLQGLQLLWTPKIKAIWTTLLPLPERQKQSLPLHRLRVSGRPQFAFNAFDQATPACIPLGIDIVLKDTLIEISRQL